MSETLFDLSGYKSASANSYHSDYTDATGTDPAWDETELYSNWKNSTAEPSNDTEYNSTQVPTMEEETSESSYATVEVVEELSPEAERQRLELLVERAFSQAGAALRSLRDKRLYRSTHKTFEYYCQERFGFNRTSAHHQSRSAEIFENLFTFSKQSRSTEVSEEPFTKSKRVLPTKETQIRPLAKLEPEEQYQVWQQAVEAAGSKVPTERIVKTAVLRYKGIVEPLKEKNPSPLEFTLGDVVEIKVLKHSPLHPFNGMWGMIEHVGSFSYKGSALPRIHNSASKRKWSRLRSNTRQILRLWGSELSGWCRILSWSRLNMQLLRCCNAQNALRRFSYNYWSGWRKST